MIKFTNKEKQIIQYIKEHTEATNAEMAVYFGIIRVDRHLHSLYIKFGIECLPNTTKIAREKLVQKCIEWRDSNGGTMC